MNRSPVFAELLPTAHGRNAVRFVGKQSGGTRIASRLAVRLVLLILVAAVVQVAQADPTPRHAWTTSQIAGTPDPPPPYRVEAIEPRLTFRQPVDLAFPPGSNRMYVVEQGGKIFSIHHDSPQPVAELAVDLKQLHSDVTAAYALTFHPDFASNRYAYVCMIRGNNHPEGTVISRFTILDTNPPTFDLNSERVIIRWLAGGHNGCCLKFGPDGYLYISTGDGAGPDPPDPLLAGQDVSNLLSAILRIDVNTAPDEKAYQIPSDNPFVDLPGARPEIWAYGFRNPWRMSFDRERGDLWVGDVGWQLWELIHLVKRGGNYGWAIMEGPQPVMPEGVRGPTPILPPTYAHPHSEAASITGGFVYYGQEFPELQGAYVYGDFQTGTIWALRHDGQQITWRQELARTPLQLVAFGQNQSGELVMLDYRGEPAIFRLVKNAIPRSAASFPRLLSQTGLFRSVAEQRPETGVLPYTVNAQHWADRATSERWLAAPGQEPMRVDAKGNWLFPNGSVLVKTIALEQEPGKPATSVRLETQLLHREEGSWRPYTYRWNDEQTDAELVPAQGATRKLTISDTNAPGGQRELTYRFASRAECQMCHNPWIEAKTTVFGVQSASPLGFSLAQLNRPWHSSQTESNAEQDGSATGTPALDHASNQLTVLRQTGWLAGHLPDLPQQDRHLVDPYDTTADLNLRARSYLHVNCAHCHQMHAGGTATIDLAFETPLEKGKLVGVGPTQGTFGISDASLIAPGDPFGSVLLYRVSKTGGGRMPRVGSEEVDERGVALLHDWIAQLTPGSTAPQPAPLTADQFEKATADEREAQIRARLNSTRGAWSLLRWLELGQLSAETRAQVLASATQHPEPDVRELYERFLPPSQRQERLGDVIDRAALLAMAGDPNQGRELFFRQGSSSCQSCHRVRGEGGMLGPDLSEIGRKYPPHDLLMHLLEPSRFIEPKYVAYLLETVDGQVYSGLLIEKSEQAIRLKTIQNEEVLVSASDVERFVPQAKSLMPELLLRDLTPQQAADLLAFLRGLK